MANQDRLFSALPERSGLYDPSFEHDACGVAMVATLHQEPTHEIVQHGLQALRNLNHRGASGAEPNSGDGAGIMVRIPDEFLRANVSFPLPEVGKYAVGIAFLPKNYGELSVLESFATEAGLKVLGTSRQPKTFKPASVAKLSRTLNSP